MEVLSGATIGDRIAELAAAKPITLAELARRADMSRGYLGDIVKQRKNDVGYFILKRIARALEVPIELLDPEESTSRLSTELPARLSALPSDVWEELSLLKSPARLWWVLDYIMAHYPAYQSLDTIILALGRVTTKEHLLSLKNGKGSIGEPLLLKLSAWTGLDHRFWVAGSPPIPTDLLADVLSAHDATECLRVVSSFQKAGFTAHDMKVCLEACKSIRGRTEIPTGGI